MTNTDSEPPGVKRKHVPMEFHCPTPLQLSLLVAWVTTGASVLDGDHSDKDRHRNLRLLKDLVFRMGLDSSFETMRQAVKGKPLYRISPELRDELVRHARYHGYVMRGATAVVPLTGNQVWTVRWLAQGYTVAEVAARKNIRPKSLHTDLKRVRDQLGCLTNTHLVGTAYARGWLPTLGEQRELSAGGRTVIGRGYVLVDPSKGES